MRNDGEIVTPCCACCGADETEFGKINTDGSAIRMGELYPLSRWPKTTRIRKAIERHRGQNGNLVCGNCYFNVTDEFDQ